MEKLGFYFHIPFCNKKCDYCDFLSGTFDESVKIKYFDALKSEIEQKAKLAQNHIVSTIYFGGGTPSSVPSAYIKTVLETVSKNYNFQPNEITVECNPESINEEKLVEYKVCGVNRISIGVQSLNDKVLASIGRLHSPKQAVEAVALARKYFESVSADLMLGLPNQTINDVIYATKTLVELGIVHLSAYGLSVEEGTPLYERVKKGLWKQDEDLACDMYDEVCKIAASCGLNRYEVSNFAYFGYECKHNFSYWKRTPYFGLGAGAHSYFLGERFNNISNVDKYIFLQAKGLSVEENRIKMSANDSEYEEIMLALRTCEGLDIEKFNQQFNCDFLAKYTDALEKNKAYLNINDRYININKDYFYIMNSILVDFLK